MLGGPVSPLYMIIENYITTGHVGGGGSQSIIHDYRELHYYRTCWGDQSVHYTRTTLLQDMLGGGAVSPLYMIIENYITTEHVGGTSQSIIHDYREAEVISCIFGVSQ